MGKNPELIFAIGITYTRDINSNALKELHIKGIALFSSQNEYDSLAFHVESYSYYLSQEESNPLSYADLLDKKSCWGDDCDKIENSSFTKNYKALKSFCKDMRYEVENVEKVKRLCLNIENLVQSLQDKTTNVKILPIHYTNQEDYEVGIIVVAHDAKFEYGSMFKISFLRKM